MRIKRFRSFRHRVPQLGGAALALALGLGLGAASGGMLGELSAQTPGCDHDECEHGHKWYWFDSHDCVDNTGANTSCAMNPEGQCTTGVCGEEPPPHL